MIDIENILNELTSQLLKTGFAEFSKDGLNIKTSCNDGCLTIKANYESKPEEDKQKSTDALTAEFENFVESLNDDFFIEVIESFAPGELKEIQKKIDSTDPSIKKEGINQFMHNLKTIAEDKVLSINEDIKECKNELKELENIKASYEHVLKTSF